MVWSLRIVLSQIKPACLYWKFERSVFRQFSFVCSILFLTDKYGFFLGLDEIVVVECFEIEKRNEFHSRFEKRAFVDWYEIKMQFETTRSRILLHIDSTWTCIWRESNDGIWTFSILHFCWSSSLIENRSAQVLLLPHSNLSSFNSSERVVSPSREHVGPPSGSC